MERKYIICDPELCTGCGICELACSAEKEKTFFPELSRIRLAVVDEKTAMSISCRFCDDTPCITACPRDALSMDEDRNVIRVDKLRCIGCGWCIEACDFGAIAISHAVKSIVFCDLCEERSQPKCDEFCPKQALKVTTFETVAQNLRDKVTKRLTGSK